MRPRFRGGNGAQGRNRTTDTVIFSHVLYQLSYLGSWNRAEGPFKLVLSGAASGVERATGSLTVVIRAVHPFRVGRRASDAVALAEPLEQVAVLAAGSAEWRMFLQLGLSAKRAGFRPVRRFRHTRPTW